MSTEIKNVMIVGGTGNLGPYLVRSLLKAGFTVSVLSRSSTSKANVADASIVQSDYTYGSLVDVFTGQDAVVSALATADVAEQRTIVDAVAAAKVKRFLPSEYGIDTSGEGLADSAAFLKGKQDVMDHVKSKEVDGLSWTAIFVGSFMDWMLIEGQGLLCLDVRTMTGELVDAGNPKFTTTTTFQVGEAVAAALVHSDKTKNQYVYVASFKTTQNEVVEAVERISGRKFTLGKVGGKELYDRGMKHVKEGEWVKGYYELASAVTYNDAPMTYFPDKAAHWMQELGLVQEETFDEVISRVLKSVQA